MAVSDGDFLFVKYLISNGTDINYKDSTENTPLHFAASSDYINIVQYLISSGADNPITYCSGGCPYKHCSISNF